MPSAGSGELLERLATRGDTELREQALHVRADGVLRDEEPLRDLLRPEVAVEQQEDLELPGRQGLRNRFGHDGLATSLAHLVEQPAGDCAGERGLALCDS